jgi:hypothetical protein
MKLKFDIVVPLTLRCGIIIITQISNKEGFKKKSTPKGIKRSKNEKW